MTPGGPDGLSPWLEFAVTCPHCGETTIVAIERDVEGEMIRDCEVCCRPSSLTVSRGEEGPELRVEPSD